MASADPGVPRKKSKPVSVMSLALSNLKRRPSRTLGLMILVAILALILFSGMTLTKSMRNGLTSIGSRFGADLIVIPKGSGSDLEGILLQGTPNFFYMDKEILEAVLEVDGVMQASPQFFLTSVAADCCDVPVEIIGFDPASDFTIQPWIAEVYTDTLQDGQLIIGSEISPYNNGTVRFYNENYPVAAQLAQTGTGLDLAVYGNWNTLMDIFAAAPRQGLGSIPNRDPEKSLSSILIRVTPGVDPLLVAQRIQLVSQDISIVRTQSMLSMISGSLNRISGFLYVFILLFAVTALFTLSIVFSVTAGERRREFAILRTLGMTRGKLSHLLLGEAVILSGVGSLLGTGLGILIMIPFSAAIGNQLSMPYLQSSLSGMLTTILLSVLITLLFGPLAASGTAWKISRAETYLTLREGE